AGEPSIDADCAAGASCGLPTDGASIGPAPDCANASRSRDAPATRSNAVATMVIIPTAAIFISLSILDAEEEYQPRSRPALGSDRRPDRGDETRPFADRFRATGEGLEANAAGMLLVCERMLLGVREVPAVGRWRSGPALL